MAKYCQSRVHMPGWISDNNLSRSQSFCIHKWNLRGETKLPVIIEVNISSRGFFQYYFRFLPVSLFLWVKSISKQRWSKRSTHRKFPPSIWDNDVKQAGTDFGLHVSWQLRQKGKHVLSQSFLFLTKEIIQIHQQTYIFLAPNSSRNFWKGGSQYLLSKKVHLAGVTISLHFKQNSSTFRILFTGGHFTREYQSNVIPRG